MSEKLEVYDLEGNLIGVQDRKKFYKEIFAEHEKTGKITKQVKSIRMLLLNSKGRIVLQKRNRQKEGNPGMYDKTMGGHVPEGESFDLTLIRECAEELGFPVSIPDEEEFSRAIKRTKLHVVGLFKKIDYVSGYMSSRTTNEGKKIVQPWLTTFYVGYDGPIQFIDGESSGIELFSLQELKDEFKKNPEKFTEDVKDMVEKYEEYLQPIN